MPLRSFDDLLILNVNYNEYLVLGFGMGKFPSGLMCGLIMPKEQSSNFCDAQVLLLRLINLNVKC